MIRILEHIFIKNNADTHDPAVRRAYGVLCGTAGIVLNLLLFGAKFAAGWLTASIAVTADAINNLSDAGSSVITLLGFKLAGQKPDSDHPYGHGHYESIAGLIVAIAILMMGFELAKSSIGNILNPKPVQFSRLGAGILAASILLKLYMAAYNRRIGRRIHSPAISAVAADSLSDAAATSVVLVCTLIGHSTGVKIDAWAGAAVSLMILRAGFTAARDTISPLLGKAPDPEFVGKIRSIVAEYPDVVGMHDLMVHDYGAGRVMISLHAEVPASGDIMVLHDIVDTIERRMKKELNCSATIHMDPISTEDADILATRALVQERICETLGSEISIHDFRMVHGSTHTKVVFDALVPYNFHLNDRDLKKRITELVQEIEGDYYAVITIDHPVA